MSGTFTEQLKHSDCKGTYALVSLGCPKNLVDSETILGRLELEGYQLVPDPEQADFAVVNTCGFIASSRQESYGVIDEMIKLKQQGQLRGLIVSGCLAERQKETLLAERPEIDHIAGVFSRDEISQLADRLFGDLAEQRAIFHPAPLQPLNDHQRMRITPQHFAYLKISEGCDRLCTFCAIPKMRGKHATKPIEEVVREATRLAEDGVKELILVAQDTTYYGRDLYGTSQLTELLQQLEKIQGLAWIRLMYLYPMYFDDRLIDHIAGSEKIIPYLDLPLQHINNQVLRRMQRKVNREATEQLLEKLRSRIDALVMRTTMITGFPGETESQFKELVDFVSAQQFERLGVFTYSLEEDTPAAKLDGRVAAPVAEERRNALMATQQEIAFQWNASQVGKQLDVLIDRPHPEEPNVWIGRTYADAPDIDGLVFVTGEGLAEGDLQACEIVTSQGYDLIAVPVNKD
ncbi:MAG: 30S ribosomal protein S12 methylthiotransferase RimO [Planctomycetota bacterium]|nr:30S ribosomal protein S12 methylthiotransferase RimO [Planctomycetota bacterium]